MSGCNVFPTWSKSWRSDGGYCQIQLLFTVSDVSCAKVQIPQQNWHPVTGLQTKKNSKGAVGFENYYFFSWEITECIQKYITLKLIKFAFVLNSLLTDVHNIDAYHVKLNIF